MRIHTAATARALARLIGRFDIAAFGIIDDNRGGLTIVDMTGALDGEPPTGAGRVWNLTRGGRLRRVTDDELAVVAQVARPWLVQGAIRRGDLGF